MLSSPSVFGILKKIWAKIKKFIKPFPFWVGNYHQIFSFSFTVWNHKLLCSILKCTFWITFCSITNCSLFFFNLFPFFFFFKLSTIFFTWKVEKSCRKQMSAQVPLWSRYNNIPKKREKLNCQMRPFTSSEIFLSFPNKVLCFSAKYNGWHQGHYWKHCMMCLSLWRKPEQMCSGMTEYLEKVAFLIWNLSMMI